jgi:hypothetical protein
MTRLLHSLSTLRAAITDDYARLASGQRLTVSGWDCLPTGFHRKVSGFPSSFPGLRLARRDPIPEGHHVDFPFQKSSGNIQHLIYRCNGSLNLIIDVKEDHPPSGSFRSLFLFHLQEASDGFNAFDLLDLTYKSFLGHFAVHRTHKHHVSPRAVHLDS